MNYLVTHGWSISQYILQYCDFGRGSCICHGESSVLSLTIYEPTTSTAQLTHLKTSPRVPSPPIYLKSTPFIRINAAQSQGHHLVSTTPIQPDTHPVSSNTHCRPTNPHPLAQTVKRSRRHTLHLHISNSRGMSSPKYHPLYVLAPGACGRDICCNHTATYYTKVPALQTPT